MNTGLLLSCISTLCSSEFVFTASIHFKDNSHLSLINAASYQRLSCGLLIATNHCRDYVFIPRLLLLLFIYVPYTEMSCICISKQKQGVYQKPKWNVNVPDSNNYSLNILKCSLPLSFTSLYAQLHLCLIMWDLMIKEGPGVDCEFAFSCWIKVTFPSKRN